LLYEDGEVIVRLRGINRLHASELARAFRHLALAPSVADAIAWHAAVDDVLARGRAEQRWIPTEAIDALLATRPEPRLLERLRVAETESILREQERDAVALLDADLDALFAATNEAIMSTELASLRPFFDTIEKSPLTDEQARAVVCFDNRVQVLAAAGSGKTSVMVARAAYAVRRGFVAPDRILLLAFNKAAAAELQQRVAARFEAAGIDFTGVEASTFHRFGLRLLGQATRRKPRLAKWVEQEREVDTVLRIVDELRDATESFRYNWDLYRLLFANKPTKLAENEPDAHDTSTGRSGYRTFGGDIVKSHGERTIADFLYLNGVRYLYEQPYAVDVADTMHSQYRPDFYYPDIDVWHEHWLLIATAEPLKSSRATRKP
jgi:DNA helicase-4